MKKMKRMLIGTLLVFTLCMLTACGNDNNNAADEVQNNANEDAIDKDNVENGTAEDENMVDDAGDSVTSDSAVLSVFSLPQTGDETQPALWMLLAVASAALIALLCFRRRKDD